METISIQLISNLVYLIQIFSITQVVISFSYFSTQEYLPSVAMRATLLKSLEYIKSVSVSIQKYERKFVIV